MCRSANWSLNGFSAPTVDKDRHMAVQSSDIRVQKSPTVWERRDENGTCFSSGFIASVFPDPNVRCIFAVNFLSNSIWLGFLQHPLEYVCLTNASGREEMVRKCVNCGHWKGIFNTVKGYESYFPGTLCLHNISWAFFNQAVKKHLLVLLCPYVSISLWSDLSTSLHFHGHRPFSHRPLFSHCKAFHWSAPLGSLNSFSTYHQPMNEFLQHTSAHVTPCWATQWIPVAFYRQFQFHTMLCQGILIEKL